MICLGELEESSSSTSFVQLAPLTLEAFPNTKKLKRASIESFEQFDTLGSLNPRYSSGTYFIVQRKLVSPSLISHMHD